MYWQLINQYVKQVKKMGSHSGNVARTTSCLANKLSWKLETQLLSTKKWNNSQTPKEYQPKWWKKYTIVLTISRELSVLAMAVMIISRTFVTWRSEYPILWRKASFRDLDQQKRKPFFKFVLITLWVTTNRQCFTKGDTYRTHSILLSWAVTSSLQPLSSRFQRMSEDLNSVWLDGSSSFMWRHMVSAPLAFNINTQFLSAIRL